MCYTCSASYYSRTSDGRLNNKMNILKTANGDKCLKLDIKEKLLKLYLLSTANKVVKAPRVK